jgi:DNA topoisomerase-1
MSTKPAEAIAVSVQLAEEHARAVGLCHVHDAAPGIARRRCGGGFVYHRPDGTRVGDERTMARIRGLAIPPAYQGVWICAQANGHLQATGFDALGRKQYRYHAQWQAVRARSKFTHLLDFAGALPRLRQRVDRDLRRASLDRERVLATALRVLDSTLIRVGNDRYTRQHGSFGLTTLRNRHVDIRGAHVFFHFIGKSKQTRALHVDDPVLARILRRCRDLPGHNLFEYLDVAGEVATIGSDDVNVHLHALTGLELTAKDFRTWGGTVHAAVSLARMGPGSSATGTERNIVQAVKDVAARLGNRPATSRKYYIHPAILDAYREGTLMRYMRPAAASKPPPRTGLSREEKAVLALLRDASKHPARRAGLRAR